MAFTVEFVKADTKSYPDSVRFKIGDNGVLTITDGDDLIHFAPHAWVSVRTAAPRRGLLN